MRGGYLMIDFSTLPQKNKLYSGANGSKRAIIYNDELYMIKFPPLAQISQNLFYSNSCVSEYIGCHIFETVGIDVQSTLLGTYNVNGTDKVVVACKDFTKSGIVLQDFTSLKNHVIDIQQKGRGTELDSIMTAIHEQSIFDADVLEQHFWNIFIVDALIGNWDRHNGNWGFLYDELNDKHSLAPVYDCGSALYPQMDLALMEIVLQDNKEMELRIFERPLSAILLNDKKINYFDFISSLEIEECNSALKRISPKIKLDSINKVIDETPYISELQKTFYKRIVKERKEKIIDYSLQRLLEKEKNREDSKKLSKAKNKEFHGLER